jgi:hypothetical protein
MEMERATKNTIRFTEILEDALSAPAIGNLYIPKSTLKEIGWTEGHKITLNIELAQ